MKDKIVFSNLNERFRFAVNILIKNEGECAWTDVLCEDCPFCESEDKCELEYRKAGTKKEFCELYLQELDKLQEDRFTRFGIFICKNGGYNYFCNRCRTHFFSWDTLAKFCPYCGRERKDK